MEKILRENQENTIFKWYILLPYPHQLLHPHIGGINQYGVLGILIFWEMA
jgi:hypothetical protein